MRQQARAQRLQPLLDLYESTVGADVTNDAEVEAAVVRARMAAQNRVAPDAPPDGEYNQGGVRPEGLEYQRDLGSEQDA